MRTYAAPLGGWLTPDPANLAAVNSANPQSWNRYAYALNNPVSSLDPFGLDRCVGDGLPEDIVTEDGCTRAGGTWISTEYTTVSVSAPPPDPVDLIPAPVFVNVTLSSQGAQNSNNAGGAGAGRSNGQPADNGKSLADVARCAAQFSSDHSMAAGLQVATGGAISKDNVFVNALLGSDAATISNLITGPNRAQTFASSGISQGIVAAVKVTANLPNPLATGLASMGTAAVSETAGGTAFVSSWTDATVATSLLGKTAGKLFAGFTIAKGIWDISTYLVGATQCY
jgi:hypothetical protein